MSAKNMIAEVIGNTVAVTAGHVSIYWLPWSGDHILGDGWSKRLKMTLFGVDDLVDCIWLIERQWRIHERLILGILVFFFITLFKKRVVSKRR